MAGSAATRDGRAPRLVPAVKGDARHPDIGGQAHGIVLALQRLRDGGLAGAGQAADEERVGMVSSPNLPRGFKKGRQLASDEDGAVCLNPQLLVWPCTVFYIRSRKYI